MSEREPRTIDLQGIMGLLPHRYPILLVDRILDFEPKQWIRGYKNVSYNEEIFQGHFPSRPVFPGVYIIEAMAQTGGCLLLQGQGRSLTVLRLKGRICKMRGEAFVDGQKVAEAEFMSMLMDLAEGEGA